jgi:HAD superfamily hydrolase (TIGR01509 family)
MSPRAVLFDFNGTLSDDEPIVCAIFQELFAERGRPLSTETYFSELAGTSDPEIVRAWLGVDDPALVAEKVARYRARVEDGSTVYEPAREAVRVAAAAAAVGVVSGATLEEIAPALTAAGLDEFVSAMVTVDDVSRGKPHPEGYLIALELLGACPERSIAFEDSEPGVEAALAAGLRCVAVLGTLPSERLARADAIVERLDADAVRQALA